MADDDEGTDSKHGGTPQTDVFQQRTQEIRADHWFPRQQELPGVLYLPPGSRGPRNLYLRRHGDSFGFTLRHFIVYPPDSANPIEGRYGGSGGNHAPMETIFVKNISNNSAASAAGLQCGDRLVGVNGVSLDGKSYAQAVHLIQGSPEYLHLWVVPKEEDVLQKLFGRTAYNPETNQRPKQLQNEQIEFRRRRDTNPRPLTQFYPNHRTRESREFQADAVSWRSLQDPTFSTCVSNCVAEQRSADNLRYVAPRDHRVIKQRSDDIYTELLIHDSCERPRAQPQVPLSRKMGRRASEGSSVCDEFHPGNSLGSEMVVSSAKMKSASKFGFPDVETMPGINNNNFRLSLDGERRESSSSLTSSIADGSKDSLSSLDSTSTLTGHETDNSAIMSRFRKSFQQKEEFLRRPSQPSETPLIQREFYGRPQKLQKPVWPPQELSPKLTKPTHHNVQRVRTDIESERGILGLASGGASDIVKEVYCDNVPVANFETGGVVNNPVMVSKSASVGRPSKDWNFVNNLERIQEGSREKNYLNGSNSLPDQSCIDDKRQVVSKRARQFETGRPLLGEDGILNDRTQFHCSELARLSSKRAVPNVAVRAREFETRSTEPSRDSTPFAAVPGRRTNRDSRSLESSDIPYRVENSTVGMRARSNSAESWDAAMQSINDSKRHKETYFASLKSRYAEQSPSIIPTTIEEAMAQPAVPYPYIPSSNNCLIPVSVEILQNAPSVSITPAITPIARPVAIRPTQLDLSSPKRQVQHLELPRSGGETSSRRSVSPVSSVDDRNKPQVVRRAKNTNIAEDERVMRRESYLKATGGERMNVDSDLSDGDVSPHIVRSNSVSGGSGSSISLDREKCLGEDSSERSICTREGPLHCKITDIDGKRATDRSWKQIWAVLRGPQLYLYKDRHQQSPIGSGDMAETALAKGIDMRAGCVRVAEDYTKRKHVLRVSSAQPCRSEILLQADSPPDLVEWVRVLQETTELEAKQQDCLSGAKQQAVPQQIPAATSVLVQGSSRLSPQPSKSKLPTFRNRSPTGQSPVSKTRKPSSQPPEGLTSPKSKTWRGRMAKQFRKIHQGATSPNSPTTPEGSTFGIPLELCPQSPTSPNVPKLVETCTEIVETKGGLDVVGIYRVPGNNAAVTGLTEEVNRSTEDVTQQDVRWNDMNVVSSLLKSFFRKLPDSLFTTCLYPQFIQADKIENPSCRMEAIRKLIHQLPTHHYSTLKHLMLHLKRVVENADVNKMEARNLAIVFGPTLVRAVEDNMVAMVTDMSHQCKIVESLVTYADWFFSNDDVETLNLPEPVVAVDCFSVEMDAANNHSLLLGNISKVEGMKGEGVSRDSKKEILTSIISAARKVKRRTIKTTNSSPESKEEATTPNGMKEFPYSSSSLNSGDQKAGVSVTDSGGPNTPVLIPTTVTEMGHQKQQSSGSNTASPSSNQDFKYSNHDEFKRRIEKFKQETEANLQRPVARKMDLSFSGGSDNMSLSACYLNTIPANSNNNSVLLKTNSASNMLTRTNNIVPLSSDRNSLNSSAFSHVQYGESMSACKNTAGNSCDRAVIRRGSSAENVSSLSVGSDLGKNVQSSGTYKNELTNVGHRSGSLDSLNKLPECAKSGSETTHEGSDFVTDLTSWMDKKIRNMHTSSSLSREDIPYADESPERSYTENNNSEKVPSSPQLYRNPSLHKSLFTTAKLQNIQAAQKSADKLKQEEKEKDDTLIDKDKDVPDNERHLIEQEIHLKRSESLSKPDRSVSPLNNKLKRSESLNKTGDKLKRSDSLTKNEKTESNISKRRELSGSGRRNTKEFSTKLKRKNGMPERSIKRRHTVGGTKDLDKILDNKNKEDSMKEEENCKEKASLRTSSPDLSSTRRERLFFEVNLIRPENMVVAFKQHLLGARPQSLPEARVFKVPLESHV